MRAITVIPMRSGSVRVDEIGDVVLTTPFLRELRRNVPMAHITLVVKPGVANLVQTSPHVDQILTYDWLHRRPYLRPDRYPRLLRLHLRKSSPAAGSVSSRSKDAFCWWRRRKRCWNSNATFWQAQEPAWSP